MNFRKSFVPPAQIFKTSSYCKTLKKKINKSKCRYFFQKYVNIFIRHIDISTLAISELIYIFLDNMFQLFLFRFPNGRFKRFQMWFASVFNLPQNRISCIKVVIFKINSPNRWFSVWKQRGQGNTPYQKYVFLFEMEWIWID